MELARPSKTMSLVSKILPSWKNAVLALLSAGLLILAFPDFEWWWMAWFALVPLMWAIEREKESVVRSFVVGWIFGTTFFFGTCWWLTFAPITYAGFPWPLAYFLILIATLGAGVFPAIFAAITSIFLRRFGSWAFLAAPFAWVFTEFLRYWLTGNNWNAIGYSQAFSGRGIFLASFGGISIVSFALLLPMSILSWLVFSENSIVKSDSFKKAVSGIMLSRTRFWSALEENRMFRLSDNPRIVLHYFLIVVLAIGTVGFTVFLIRDDHYFATISDSPKVTSIVAIQPNVPMSSLDLTKWRHLRQRQIEQAEAAIRQLPTADRQLPTTVILPESPMNFMYEDDREFQKFIDDFARRNNVSVLFNSAEPDATNGKYFNSAVMVGPDGREAGQYDKIFLLPFGEAVPPPLDAIVPGFVGNFSYGREYDILPIGDAKAGVMICFESHFGQLSREYVRNGADVLIEMTNDGYLGPTPVLRQHLANAVFRAVETNRPVLRVTNVGITAYITEKGAVLDAAPTYQEDTRVWTVSKSDGSQTFYVKYGDWFAWLCTVVTLGLLALIVVKRKTNES